MIPGIDPKVDIAFKRVFGSPPWRNLTISLIEAVLQPAPWQRLADLELLNPYTEPITCDDKLSILDIKARDDQGRLYNVEMQMVASASLPQRLLYYWALLYRSQLARGDDYSQLCPTISICFVNGRMFADQRNYHHRFQLLDPTDSLVLTEDLDIHVLELVNFQHRLENLSSPLDFWLYFLKNGVTLDADELPAPLDNRELRQAMEVLKMFSQDEMSRELYEGRLKAERDAKMHYVDAQRAQAQLTERNGSAGNWSNSDWKPSSSNATPSSSGDRAGREPRRRTAATRRRTAAARRRTAASAGTGSENSVVRAAVGASGDRHDRAAAALTCSVAGDGRWTGTAMAPHTAAATSRIRHWLATGCRSPSFTARLAVWVQ